MKKLSEKDRAQWRNIWCILRSLDLHELDELSPFSRWPSFREDPHGFLVRADDRKASAIWRAVEKRMSGGEEAEMTNAPITPDEFRLQMKEIKENGNQEEAHIEADKLMCSLLDTLGYGQGVATFRGMYKWYT